MGVGGGEQREDERKGMVSGLEIWADCGSICWRNNFRRRGMLERRMRAWF